MIAEQKAHCPDQRSNSDAEIVGAGLRAIMKLRAVLTDMCPLRDSHSSKTTVCVADISAGTRSSSLSLLKIGMP